ncbi:MAG: DNA-processing protein DprA [Solirubrobacteraceae bacterium]
MEETAALVALLRAGGRAWARYIARTRRERGARAVSALAVLEQELGLLAYDALATAGEQIQEWRARGYRLVSILDGDYPANLSVVDGRPPLLFIVGTLSMDDRHSVSVIGTRRPTEEARRLAAAAAFELSKAGYVIFSGLAAGIDACAHRAVLERGGRTVAVIGSGLDHSYPPENAQLQDQIARTGAVISQFWPEDRPTPRSFPARNAVMSGLTLASVIVEASPMSGTRVQARHALSQGRKLILMGPVMTQTWARELAERPGVAVAKTIDELLLALKR